MIKNYLLNDLAGVREPETIEECIARGEKFRAKIKEYGMQNVNEDETILIVSHSRMINFFFGTCIKNDEGRWDWGTHTETGKTYRTEI